jgi:hypothetical protein
VTPLAIIRAMNSPGPERAGVLVIRVWLEAGSERPRVRIIARVNVTEGRETTHAASSVDEVCALVRDWMTEFTGRSPAP